MLIPLERLNLTELIPNIKSVMNKLPANQRKKARIGVLKIPTDYPYRNPIPSRLKYEQHALIELQNNPNIDIIRANKTTQLAILEKTEYFQKMYKALNKTPHEILKKDPSRKTITKLAEFKYHSSLPKTIKKS